MTETTSLFWDCACETGYVHPVTQEKCDACGEERDGADTPDSRIDEVVEAYPRVPRSDLVRYEVALPFCEALSDAETDAFFAAQSVLAGAGESVMDVIGFLFPEGS